MKTNIDKLRSVLQKKSIAVGISEPDQWLSTGNYALNFNLTGNFMKGIPNRRTVMFWGLSGTGKTFIVSSIAREAQKTGYLIVYIDTEDAIHTEYLEKIGVDLSDENFLPIRVSTLEEITEVMSSCFNTFDKDEKICFIVDSLSMLETEKEKEDFDSGKMTTDMGLFAKRLKLFMKNINNKISERDAFFIATNHAYLNQDIRNGEGVAIPSGGKGFQFIPSISVYLSKLKLKEGTETIGIRMTAETTKSRFTKLGGKIQLSVPYDKGIDPYDGLLDIAVDAGLVDNSTKGWYKIETKNGEELKFRAKDFSEYAHYIFDFDTHEPVEELNESDAFVKE